MTFKVVSTSPTFGAYAQEPVDYLKQRGCELKMVAGAGKMSEAELAENVKDADAIITGIEKLTATVIQSCPNLKIIAKHGAGVDNVVVPAATRQGVAVVSAAGANSEAVADLTIALFLALARSIPFADRSVKGGNWPRVVGLQFNEKVLGIIGFGQIGRKVAMRASGFGMKSLTYDVFQDETAAKQLNATYVPLDRLIKESDFISIHVPLIPATKGLISTRQFQMMKKEAFLINISRGEIVDEAALYTALKEGRIKGAALDVYAKEPPSVDSPLLKLDNVITTPHMGGYTIEALKETGMMNVKGIIDVKEGKQPQCLTNPEVYKKK